MFFNLKMKMKIGYARVSTQDQKLELQIDALEQDGCEQIYQEKKSGKNKERPDLEQMLAHLWPGDIVVVWKLDRLGRSLKDLVSLMDEFVNLKDGINTSPLLVGLPLISLPLFLSSFAS